MYYLNALRVIYIISCGGSYNAGQVIEKTNDYTGLDTLIRLDGYYYHEDIFGTQSPSPFVLSKDGKVEVFFFTFKTHEEIQNSINRSKAYYGNYILANDTIKIKWKEKYNLNSYYVFSEKYIIVNDTTLRRIWFLCETCEKYKNEEQNPVRDEICKFFKYP